MATYGASPEGDGLDALFESSPDLGVHTSAAAQMGFLLGLAAGLSAPFSLMHSVSLALGLAALGFAFVGLVTTSRQTVAGGALVPAGIAFAFGALVLVGLRYAGMETGVGDPYVPEIRDWLERLNARVFGA